MRTHQVETALFLSLILTTACSNPAFEDGPPESLSGGAAAAGAAGSAQEPTAGAAGEGSQTGTEDHDASAPKPDADGTDPGDPDAGESDAGDFDPGDPDAMAPDGDAHEDPSCPTGWADCDGDDSNGCEVSIADDLANCGGCGSWCEPAAHASVTCEQGACVLACDPGFDDCDTNPANGCEADLSGVDHCQACGNACGGAEHASAVCTDSGCGHACEPGWDDCDGDPVNGCETDLSSTASHCGGCGDACPPRPNAAAVCESATCGFACIAGFEDCDGTVGNGCETDLHNDPGNCGACGQSCGDAHATAACGGGDCSLVCDAGWDDCDGDNDNGCELHIDEDVENCGACGHACGDAHGTPGCSAGDCSITCDQGYADCDGKEHNGCEIDLNTDSENCGVCGRDCLGEACSNGLCVPKVVTSAADYTIEAGVVYVSTGTQIKRMAGSGAGFATVLVGGLDHAVEPTLGENLVYFFNGESTERSLRSAPRVGSGVAYPVVLDDDIFHNAAGLAFDDGKLYYRCGDGIYQRDAAPGGVPQRIGNAATDVTELHVEADHVYWVAPYSGRIGRTAKAGTGSFVLTNAFSRPSDLAVDGLWVFWTTELGKVGRVGVDGTGQATLFQAMGTGRTLAADGDGLYFANDEGEIWKLDVVGSGKLLLADGQDMPDDIAVDGDWVYWRSRGQTNKVMRVAR